MRDLEVVSLTDVLEFREGPGIMAVDFHHDGVPLIRLAGLKSGAGLLTGCNFLDPDKVASKWSQFRVAVGDVLLSTSASLGEVAVVDESAAGAVPYTGIIRFRPRDERIAAEFIRFALESPDFKQQILEMGVGSVMNHFGPSHLRHMSLRVPCVPQQRAIAEVLGALDDKIAANAMLVDAATRLCVAMLADVRPSVPLGDVVVHHKESVSPSDFGHADVTHFSLPAFDAGQDLEVVDPTSIKSSKFAIRKPSVLVSKLNPRFPRIWDVPTVPSSHAFASTEFLVLESKHSSSSTLWAVLSQPTFKASLESKVAGTSGSHQRVRPADLLATEVADPQSLTKQQQSTITTIGRRVANCRQESRSIAVVRNALLPLLMSGKLRVRDAERQVEGVV